MLGWIGLGGVGNTQHSNLIICVVCSKPWMLGILKWGMAQIWSCGWALCKYKVIKKSSKHIFFCFNRRPGLKTQEWGWLETPIHNWIHWPSLQLMICFDLTEGIFIKRGLRKKSRVCIGIVSQIKRSGSRISHSTVSGSGSTSSRFESSHC